ncbi:hypothetical protein PIB30_023842 [Stylosanthes scabra]|uniref:Uncharacterized protein n=1 Tax=Stylosanthes scabra TaxID=79078 RepID=A0ABU6Q959_9FABA|nr:hypothetical protein [Stylosanthes scabra]
MAVIAEKTLSRAVASGESRWLVVSRDAFEKIIKAREKFVIEDFATKDCFSFTAPRILSDSYQWEPIQEWMTLKLKNKEFEVYAREFGRDVYSIQAHPKALMERG